MPNHLQWHTHPFGVSARLKPGTVLSALSASNVCAVDPMIRHASDAHGGAVEARARLALAWIKAWKTKTKKKLNRKKDDFRNSPAPLLAFDMEARGLLTTRRHLLASVYCMPRSRPFGSLFFFSFFFFSFYP